MELVIKKWRKIRVFLIFFLIIGLLQGCASSDPSRTTAGGIDSTYTGINTSLSNVGKGSLADAYQNSSQTSKGVIIGGIAGGVIGGITNGIGAVGGIATGAILGGALGAYIDAHTTVVDKLQNRGVKVFVLGDQVMIILPSDRLFYSSSSNLRYDQYSTLDLVAQLIGNYSNMSVKVSSYTSANGPAPIDLALSQQQANNVAKYLWKRGVNTRMLYAQGYGGSHLVMADSATCNLNDNDRVEITFEKLPV